MSTNNQNPCRHNCDWTDGDAPDIADHGCCVPYPIRRDCAAPIVPLPECDEAEPVVTYDPETESFTVTTILYDENCSPILDQNNDAITTIII